MIYIIGKSVIRMDIVYANTKVEKVMTDAKQLVKKVGSDTAKAIIKRKNQLEAFSHIGELMRSGIDNPHLLENNLYGCIGWSVTANLRFILDIGLEKDEKYSQEMYLKEKITVKGVMDYHGGKDEWIIS